MISFHFSGVRWRYRFFALWKNNDKHKDASTIWREIFKLNKRSDPQHFQRKEISLQSSHCSKMWKMSLQKKFWRKNYCTGLLFNKLHCKTSDLQHQICHVTEITGKKPFLFTVWWLQKTPVAKEEESDAHKTRTNEP